MDMQGIGPGPIFKEKVKVKSGYAGPAPMHVLSRPESRLESSYVVSSFRLLNREWFLSIRL